MFTGNEDMIRKITGCGVGELYETNISQKISQKKERSKANILDIGNLDIGKLKFDDDGKPIYDDNKATFNFHLYPEDENIAIRVAKEIRERRIAVLKEFENMEQSGLKK